MLIILEVESVMMISLEGPEAAGKSSQISYIADYYRQRGYRVTCTREPGAGRIGQQIRKILLDVDNTDLVPIAELLLYMADRRQHIETVIKPGLADGGVVICDRFIHSTIAYQHGARGLDRSMIDTLQEIATGGLMPDLTILLDLDVEVGLARANKAVDERSRDAEAARFENEAIEFHRSVRSMYLQLAREDSRIVVVDADQIKRHVSVDIGRILNRTHIVRTVV